MTVSIFDLFSVGIGPSSSHTVGPMRAARGFLERADRQGQLCQAKRIEVHLYGSLALTGKGHGSDVALVMGLLGHRPGSIDPRRVASYFGEVINRQQLHLLGRRWVDFDNHKNLIFHLDTSLPKHTNGMCFKLFGAKKLLLYEDTTYSVGGGFVVADSEVNNELASTTAPVTRGGVDFPFACADELLNICQREGLSIAEVVMANEVAIKTATGSFGIEEAKAIINADLLQRWQVMQDCISCGSQRDGELAGGLHVKRRAGPLYRKLMKKQQDKESADEMNWINMYALAVSEENASGGRVVTAPTNGAAGIIPAVISYYVNFCSGDEKGICRFLLTAGAVGLLYKYGASLSGAEVGCQGEVGVACSMAAAGLCAAWKASAQQIENAAEIGMEHHLGLTCDPVGGLVQIPCIERNAMAAVQAVNTAKLAMIGDGTHRISLDEVIKTMRETGLDMMSKYKETALGGLAKTAKIAVNLPSC